MTQRSLFGPTLAEARRELREQLDAGILCSCCGQYAKRYRRKINSAQAHDLILLYLHQRRYPSDEWVNLNQWRTRPGKKPRSRELPMLRHWGLIEERAGSKDDGNPRTGLWRPTEKGQLFARAIAEVPAYAVLYAGKLERLEGDPVNVRQALGSRFNWTELMRGNAGSFAA